MKDRKILIAILIFASALRFWKLGSNPPSLYWDEVSLGYNAYSILTTGHDEHGDFLPITRFVAFGDYKPAGYIYATVPSIAIFGLNEFAVRFPSALAGTLTVLMTYLLVKELFKNKKTMEQWNNGTIAAIATLLLAISPWHLQFSRGAFEANLATLFSTAGVYFFIKGLKHGKLMTLSFTLFALSMYTFNTHRVFVPILIMGLVLIHAVKLRKIKGWTIAAALVGFILLTPLIPFLLTREGQLRFQEVTIFRNLDPIITANQRIERESNSILARVMHNRRVQFALEFAKHYVDHLRTDFLFFSGDVNPRLGTRDQGVLFPIELPLILAGIYFLVRKRHPSAILLFYWLLVGIIPAATARETPHALRTLNILPTPQILAAVAISGLYQAVKRKRMYLVIITMSYMLLAIGYLHTYHVHYPRQWAASWQYGYKQMVETVSKLEAKYDRVYITKKYGRPYIYLLFYQQYPPKKYWDNRDLERDWYGLYSVHGLGKYRFADAAMHEKKEGERWLLVTGPEGLPDEAGKITTVKFPNGEVAFEIGELI